MHTCTPPANPLCLALACCASCPCLQSLIDDFSCALKKRMLLQGRMYVFQEHACFHCNLFGYQKIKASSGCTTTPVLHLRCACSACAAVCTVGPVLLSHAKLQAWVQHRGTAICVRGSLPLKLLTRLSPLI